MTLLRSGLLRAGMMSVVLVANSAVSQAEPSFERSVRGLLRLQDQMAAGQGSAIEAQRQIITNIEEHFGGGGRLPEATIANAKAALSYVLSGGPPEIAGQLAKEEHLAELYKRLLNAAVHFKKGEDTEARKLLNHVEPLLLPPDIAGRVALMQAMLVPDTDGEKKSALLDRAAQLMPGTLVEEAALRRSVNVAAKQSGQSGMWKLSDKYLRRFGKSLFARAFAADLLTMIVASETLGAESNGNKLELLMNRLPIAERRQSYILLAKLATQNGLPGLAQFGARRARRLASEGGSEWQRGILYDAIHGMVGERYSEYLQQLQNLDPKLLDNSEQMLLRAALALAERMRSPGKVDEAKFEGRKQIDLPQEHQALLARAEQKLKAAETLIRNLDDKP